MRRLRAFLAAAAMAALPAACADDYEPLGPPPEAAIFIYPDEMVMAAGDSLRVRAAYTATTVVEVESRDTTVARVRMITPPGTAGTRHGWVYAGVPGTTWAVVSVVEAPGRSDSLRVQVTP